MVDVVPDGFAPLTPEKPQVKYQFAISDGIEGKLFTMIIIDPQGPRQIYGH